MFGLSKPNLSNCLTTFWQTLEDSFSAVSTPIFAISQLLLVNTRWKGLDKIYQIHMRPHYIALFESNLETTKSAPGKRHPGEK